MSLYLGKDKVSVGARARGLIRITIVDGPAGVTATAELQNSSYSASGVSNLAGIISIPVDRFGTYRLTYSDYKVRGSKTVTIVSPNATVEVAALYSSATTYTVRIDESNTNPLTSCEYQDGAAGMTKGSSAWDSMPIFNSIHPCVFAAGTVQYYLNPNDFTKKLNPYDPDDETNGDDAVLTGADGDVMIEFPKFAYRIQREGQYLYVSVTNDEEVALASNSGYSYAAFSRLTEGDLNNFYYGAFKGWVDGDGYLRSVVGQQPTSNKTILEFRVCAQNRNGANNEFHYQQNVFANLTAIQCLYLIKYGNRNGQSALGQGVTGVTDDSTSNLAYVTGYNAAADDGEITGTISDSTSMLKKGMCWGSTNTKQHIKLFGIEDFWGNIWEWVDGCTTNASRQIITSWNTFSGEPVTATSPQTTSSGLSSNSSGYVKKVAGTTAAGFMPVQFGGTASTTTDWADSGYLYASRVLQAGGRWSNGAAAGPFFLDATNDSSSRSRVIAARLLYK